MLKDDKSGSILDFLNEFDRRQLLYQQYTQKCVMQSKAFFDDAILQPMKLCDSSVEYLISGFGEQIKLTDEKPILKLQLLTAYLQSYDASFQLIMEGNYIKAAGTLKQDYEIIVSLNEINNGRHQHGKTPHAQNGPISFKEMNGYLNDMAHISKPDIIFDILKYIEGGKFIGISAIKKFNKKFAHRLMAYNVSIKVEVLRQALKLYHESVGNNERYRIALYHYKVINDKYIELGLFE